MCLHWLCSAVPAPLRAAELFSGTLTGHYKQPNWYWLVSCMQQRHVLATVSYYEHARMSHEPSDINGYKANCLHYVWTESA
jgi:hypothetical protein